MPQPQLVDPVNTIVWLSTERKDALDYLRAAQANLRKERALHSKTRWFRQQDEHWVLCALDRYWGVISREELLNEGPGSSFTKWGNYYRNHKDALTP